MYKKQINIDIKADPVINDYANVIPIFRAINIGESLIACARAFWIMQAFPRCKICICICASAGKDAGCRPLIKKRFVHFRHQRKIQEDNDLFIRIYSYI